MKESVQSSASPFLIQPHPALPAGPQPQAAGQLALRQAQPLYSTLHLAFILFDAREARTLVDPSSKSPPPV